MPYIKYNVYTILRSECRVAALMNGLRVYETEEKKNKICRHLFHLLVWCSGLVGGRHHRISSIGWLFRFIRLGRDHAVAFGHTADIGCLQIGKRINPKNHFISSVERRPTPSKGRR